MADPAWYDVSGGFLAALAGMAVATYACRALGVWMMGHVPLTRRVRLALSALPGSIVVSTVVPLTLKGGPGAALGIVAALCSMMLKRNELIALVVGLAVVSLARAAGL
jgi:uncharacterized membrane protein